MMVKVCGITRREDALVAAEAAVEVGVQVGLGIAREGGHFQPAQPQCQGGQQPDGARPHDGGATRSPDTQTTLNFVGLSDAFFNDGHGFKQHTNLFEAGRHFYDELDIIDVVLG